MRNDAYATPAPKIQTINHTSYRDLPQCTTTFLTTVPLSQPQYTRNMNVPQLTNIDPSSTREEPNLTINTSSSINNRTPQNKNDTLKKKSIS